jgi:hypothetical protein
VGWKEENLRCEATFCKTQQREKEVKRHLEKKMRSLETSYTFFIRESYLQALQTDRAGQLMLIIFLHHACPELKSLLSQPHLLYVILLTRSILQLLCARTSDRVIQCVQLSHLNVFISLG